MTRTLFPSAPLLVFLLAAFPLMASAAPQTSRTPSIHSRYGGPSYTGKSDLAVLASLERAGGGAGHFAILEALDTMVGVPLVGAELTKLNTQYGRDKVVSWVKVFDFAVTDALKIETKTGMKLPLGRFSRQAARRGACPSWEGQVRDVHCRIPAG